MFFVGWMYFGESDMLRVLSLFRLHDAFRCQAFVFALLPAVEPPCLATRLP